MDARLMLVIAGSFGLATAAMVEPAKPVSPAADQAVKERPVVLASADVPAVSAVADPNAPAAAPVTAPKRRTARVTTCRCADTPNP